MESYEEIEKITAWEPIRYMYQWQIPVSIKQTCLPNILLMFAPGETPHEDEENIHKSHESCESVNGKK